MSLSQGRQTLLTQTAFEVARRAVAGDGSRRASLRWLAHGSYELKGVDEAVEIFEVGLEGFAPLTPPPDSAKARRAGADETVTGWRPAPGLEIPLRPNWVVDDKISEGSSGEAWLASHSRTQERRVFKFCYDRSRIEAMKREVTLFSLLKEEQGERNDIARILDWNYEERNLELASIAVGSALGRTGNVSLVIFGALALGAAGIALRVQGRTARAERRKGGESKAGP